MLEDASVSIGGESPAISSESIQVSWSFAMNEPSVAQLALSRRFFESNNALNRHAEDMHLTDCFNPATPISTSTSSSCPVLITEHGSPTGESLL